MARFRGRRRPAGARPREDPLSDGMISPVIWVVIAAASRSMFAARRTLCFAHPAVAPVSAAIVAVKSWRRVSRTSAACISWARRSLGPNADQAGKAAAAAVAAASASAIVAAAARVATSPLSGLCRSNTAASEASGSRSSIRSFMSNIFSSTRFGGAGRTAAPARRRSAWTKAQRRRCRSCRWRMAELLPFGEICAVHDDAIS